MTQGQGGLFPCPMWEPRSLADGGSSGQTGIGVAFSEVLGGSLGDESLREYPSDCSALGACVTELLPDRHQVRVLLVQLVL
jgi:hypothetical protein